MMERVLGPTQKERLQLIMLEVTLRKRMRQLRRAKKALEFYAVEKNYQWTGWQGDPEKSPVSKDSGKCARTTLGRLEDV